MKNTHLEHLEDDILNNGSNGGRNAIKILRELGLMLTEPHSNIQITTKWDGAPAIVCGQHPTTGKFFVGTKAVFNKGTPKICRSNSDIDTYYAGQLADKLKVCLEHLPKLGIKGVVQGDLLFYNDVITRNVNGEPCYVFTPNTITYAVPVKGDMGKKIRSSKMGIVFHTKYSGGNGTVRDMKASFGVNTSSMKSMDVAVFSSNFKDVTGASAFDRNTLSKFISATNRAEGSLKQASQFLDILGQTGSGKFLLSEVFKLFFNSYIKKGVKFSSTADVSNAFEKFYKQILEKEIQSKKTEATKTKYKKIQTDGIKFIKTYARPIYMTVASYMNLTECKTLIIRQLEKVNTIGTYIKTDNGYRVTAPEGFVAIKSGSALKLVDRLEFSKTNFTIEKNWG